MKTYLFDYQDYMPTAQLVKIDKLQNSPSDDNDKLDDSSDELFVGK